MLPGDFAFRDALDQRRHRGRRSGATANPLLHKGLRNIEFLAEFPLGKAVLRQISLNRMPWFFAVSFCHKQRLIALLLHKSKAFSVDLKQQC
jgi:hypothetical protein